MNNDNESLLEVGSSGNSRGTVRRPYQFDWRKSKTEICLFGSLALIIGLLFFVSNIGVISNNTSTLNQQTNITSSLTSTTPMPTSNNNNMIHEYLVEANQVKQELMPLVLKTEILRAYEEGFLSFNVSSDSYQNQTNSLGLSIPGLDSLNAQTLGFFAPGLNEKYPNAIINAYGRVTQNPQIFFNTYQDIKIESSSELAIHAIPMNQTDEEEAFVLNLHLNLTLTNYTFNAWGDRWFVALNDASCGLSLARSSVGTVYLSLLNDILGTLCGDPLRDNWNEGQAITGVQLPPPPLADPALTPAQGIVVGRNPNIDLAEDVQQTLASLYVLKNDWQNEFERLLANFENP